MLKGVSLLLTTDSARGTTVADRPDHARMCRALGGRCFSVLQVRSAFGLSRRRAVPPGQACPSARMLQAHIGC
jgi:hypothetical protein